MIILICSIILSVLTGFFTTSLILRKLDASGPGLLFKLSLGSGIGIGISSIIYFLNLCIFGPNVLLTLSAEIALFLILGALYFSCVPSANTGIFKVFHMDRESHEPLILRLVPLAFIVVLIGSAVTFIRMVFIIPHGRFDAWNIWNMRARFFFRGGENWQVGFSPPLDHTDYPLYLSSYIGRTWSYIGDDTIFVPLLLAILFIIISVLITYSILSLFKSKNQGLIAGMLLIGTPILIKIATSQYSDVTLGFFYLASLSLILFSERFPAGSGPYLILCGIAVGMAGWVKNEGLLFIISITPVLIASSYIKVGFFGAIRRFTYFAIGLLPVLAVIIYFKFGFNVQNDLVGAQDFESISGRLLDLSRYPVVLENYIKGVFNFGKFAFSPLIILGIYAVLAGVKIRANMVNGLLTSLFIVIFVVAGYFFVYVITPYDIKWHFLTSFQRLVLHLWPSIVLMYFLVVRSPEEILVSER